MAQLIFPHPNSNLQISCPNPNPNIPQSLVPKSHAQSTLRPSMRCFPWSLPWLSYALHDHASQQRWWPQKCRAATTASRGPQSETSEKHEEPMNNHEKLRFWKPSKMHENAWLVKGNHGILDSKHMTLLDVQKVNCVLVLYAQNWLNMCKKVSSLKFTLNGISFVNVPLANC